MKFAPITIISAGSMAGSLSSNGVDLSDSICGSIQAVWTGSSPAGTFKVQVSNDPVVALPGSSNPSSNVVNWTDYSGSSLAITTTGSWVWDLNLMGYRWARLVYTRVSGTGSLTANFMIKG